MQLSMVLLDYLYTMAVHGGGERNVSRERREKKKG
jgi:hypothetical protein